MDMIGRIRHLHARKNQSERKISRMTGLSRNTVAKWLHGEVAGPHRSTGAANSPTPAASPRWVAWRAGAFATCMLTAVDKLKKGKGRIVNARFATMSAHYLYDPDFCNVASGWERGVVEKNVQDSRRPGPAGASTRPCGSTRPRSSSAASPNSTPGWASAAAVCGTRCATRSTRSSAWPRCSNMSERT